jgi:alkylated DNA repair dioxygenase AlkB
VDAVADAGRPLELPGADLLWWPQLLATPVAQQAEHDLQHELPWQQRSIRMFGREVLEPRLTSWHGDPEAHYRYSGRDNAPLPWTATLLRMREAVEQATGEVFNSVLANLYRDGADHMGWHADDERELGGRPVIASLSLGAVRRFQFRPRPKGAVLLTLELGPGSLLLMAGQTQRHYHHRVPATARTAGRRINLTFRRIIPTADRLGR